MICCFVNIFVRFSFSVVANEVILFQALGPKKFQQADFCPINIEPIINCLSGPPTWMTGDKLVAEESFGGESKCFNSNYDRPLCLKSYCDEELGVIWVNFGQIKFKCQYDGQKIDVNITGTNFLIECPKKAVLCPEMICPSDCGGKAVCNWTLPVPKCEQPHDKGYINAVYHNDEEKLPGDSQISVNGTVGGGYPEEDDQEGSDNEGGSEGSPDNKASLSKGGKQHILLFFVFVIFFQM